MTDDMSASPSRPVDSTNVTASKAPAPLPFMLGSAAIPPYFKTPHEPRDVRVVYADVLPEDDPLFDPSAELDLALDSNQRLKLTPFEILTYPLRTAANKAQNELHQLLYEFRWRMPTIPKETTIEQRVLLHIDDAFFLEKAMSTVVEARRGIDKEVPILKAKLGVKYRGAAESAIDGVREEVEHLISRVERWVKLPCKFQNQNGELRLKASLLKTLTSVYSYAGIKDDQSLTFQVGDEVILRMLRAYILNIQGRLNYIQMKEVFESEVRHLASELKSDEEF